MKKNKKLFISLSGMSGSGKSYLLNTLSQYAEELNKYMAAYDIGPRDKFIGIVQEGARKLLSTKHKDLDLSRYSASTYDKLDKKDKAKYEKWQKDLCKEFKSELKRHKDYDIIIADRSMFDQLVYYDLQCGVMNKTRNNIIELYKDLKKKYYVVTLLTDTPLTKILSNFEKDPHHHYTTNADYLFREKLKFLNLANARLSDDYFCMISPMDDDFKPIELFNTILNTYERINNE